MVKAKVWKIHKLFDGAPKVDDLIYTEEDLPDIKDGGKFNQLKIRLGNYSIQSLTTCSH